MKHIYKKQRWLMQRQLTNPNFYVMLLADAALFAMAYVLSYLFRFEFNFNETDFQQIGAVLCWLIPLKLVVFFGFGLYRGMWRYTSVRDVRSLAHASLLSMLLGMAVILYAYRFQGFSRAVFLMDGVLTILLTGGIRLAIRSYYAKQLYRKDGRISLHAKKNPVRVLMIGAGDAGEKVLREIMDNPGVNLFPVGFLDDDSRKKGKAIHGVPILGSVEQITRIPVEYDEILIAIPSAKAVQMRRIVDLCDSTGRRVRTVPSIGELIDGRISMKAIREVRIEDIIGRDEVVLDQNKISAFLKGKRVLVTGGGGSIGAELVRQICRFGPESVAVIDFSEYNLFQIEIECQRRFKSIPFSFYLADIRDSAVMNRISESFAPHIIFHAAAYKHVPIQEIHPREAVINNVLGTRNLVEAALTVNAECFVLVSTDKAVRPTNVMGATKRVAELFVESINRRTSTRFIAVRFGNVLSSSGSAIPLFQEQIAKGGPITITHPDVTRYFMSIPEAAQLILQAGTMGLGGEIFILDMGEPVRIVDMARDLIRLHGLEPDRDIPIEFIGLRPGEKLYEELITVGEGIFGTSHNKIMVLRNNGSNPSDLLKEIEELILIARTGDSMAIKKKLRKIIPEYSPQIIDADTLRL
jgi:FlaA1/EpsC-like NDP-sugar epimerase